jgi:hypothetical protein
VARAARSPSTVADRLRQYGPAARGRWKPFFEQAGLSYPARRLTFIGLKQERSLEVWGAGDDGAWRLLRTLPVLGASGRLGPKLREGDRQVPEGLYRVEALNPNSRFHLSLRLNYPNADDRRRGAADGRTNLGSDIMIHGNSVSIGCLAMGDEATEDLFILATECGISNVSVLLSPVDFRARELPPDMPAVPPWTAELYETLRAALRPFAPPPPRQETHE